jgi:aminoglycoside phosphotransferase family enzyme
MVATLVGMVEPTLAEKVRFLSSTGAYSDATAPVAVRETHLSFVFLTDAHVYKLKKPARQPLFDYSRLEGREHNSREEVRLNRRLAPDTYLGVVPLNCDAVGRMSLGGHGEVVDWLVKMRRLPANKMLDAKLLHGEAHERDISELGEVLVAFYARTGRRAVGGAAYAGRFLREQELNREVLLGREFAVPQDNLVSSLTRLDRMLRANQRLLEARADQGHILEGHGDLRPEHVCLTQPIVIFDCLEFSLDLRSVDPLDELTYLGLECALLGAPWVGPLLIEQITRGLGDRATPELLRVYAASRAMLRVRLALAHLLDPQPREPAKWEPLAQRYLDLADEAMSAAG